MPKVLQVKAEPLTADAFHPFGQVIGMDTVQMKIVNDRFRMGTINMKCQPFRITHLNRHIKSTQALIPLGGKACLVVVAPPTGGLGWRVTEWRHQEGEPRNVRLGTVNTRLRGRR
jgi:ureidoglycolate hydrolase